MIALKFTVNQQDIEITVPDSMRLLDILREELNLTGTKEGCGIGECGACTVIMDGAAVNSCLILAEQCQGSRVETVENLEKDKILSQLQEAFLENGAVQCGFCTPGMLMSAKALLAQNPHPSLEEIKTALEGNLCRCTGYVPIIESVQKAAEKLGKDAK
ncbi:MAG: aerobic carbon-monoxide dehydrogenase small subunit [Candidatus Cloacimonadota bacterium]|jgi:carbon-monoxide dehydrogenase small subunit|nr:aerobic carbon-monoxide dehydrogenase small subunit [Candidatus Cloacimonadota bacterium]